MNDIDRTPARFSAGLAVGAGGVALAAVATPSAAPWGVAGVALLLVGVLRGSRRAVTFGALLAFGGVVAASLADAPAAAVLIGTGAAVLAWDFGEQAINVGEQLGRAASTRNGELVHAANSTLVAVAGIGLGYGLYLIASGGQPVTALVVLLGAGILLAVALRD